MTRETEHSRLKLMRMMAWLLVLMIWDLAPAVQGPAPVVRDQAAAVSTAVPGQAVAESRSTGATAAAWDVLHYDAQIEPDISGKTIKGRVRIRISDLEFRISNLRDGFRNSDLRERISEFGFRISDLRESGSRGSTRITPIGDYLGWQSPTATQSGRDRSIELDCGDLTIDAVREGGRPLKFAVRDKRVSISLLRRAWWLGQKREIEIEYHGAPRRGIRFFPERSQVYTVFSTSQWLPCIDAPDDKATLRLRLIVRKRLIAVANGLLVARSENVPATAGVTRPLLPNSHQVVYEWKQDTPVPSYTFGFAVGPFRTVTDKRGRVELRHLFTEYTDDEVRRIFRHTRDMLDFYEDRAGVPYADTIYTQVLAAGGVEQEMSSFTALRETYGREVLKDQRAVWLGAHELAHQWWGNMVTCRDWNHFWLNEGMATFMAAAYLEHRFGRAEYLREIETYRANYQKVRDAGKDRSLVFPDWLHPTAEDRTLVYDKGAYVLHLLRDELGDKAFWAGIRLYTRKYFGKSVTTSDFQAAMEEASGKKLEQFFAKWVRNQEPVAEGGIRKK